MFRFFFYCLLFFHVYSTSLLSYSTSYSFSLDTLTTITDNSYYYSNFEYHRVFKNFSFINLGIGKTYFNSKNKSNPFHLSVSRGRFFKSFNSLKLYYAINLNSCMNRRSSSLFFIGKFGFIRRLSKNGAILSDVGFGSSISGNLTYSSKVGYYHYYGAGIDHQKKSTRLKKVKRRVLWFFWI